MAEPARVRVVLPAPLLALFPGAPCDVAVPADTVSALLDALDARWPGMRDRLSDSSPRIRRHINIWVDGERATLATRLTPGTEVLVMTAISGG
jgi:molybdopterin synthase sulfur carrier subunit